MLRALLAGLVLLNLLFFGWTQGWLDTVVGIKAQGDREPERLARQIHPELITILPPAKRLMFSPINARKSAKISRGQSSNSGCVAKSDRLYETKQGRWQQ